VSSAQKFYSKPDRYPELVEAGLRWQPENFYEQRIRLRSVTNGPRNRDWVEAMIRLALQGGNGIGNLDVYAGYSPHLKDLAHTAQIVILRRTTDPKVALAAAVGVAFLARKVVSLPLEVQYSPSATSILAIAGWATNQELEGSTRRLFAGELCKSLGKPDCEGTVRPASSNSEEGQSLARFDSWFEERRTALEKEAATEGPKFRDLAAELHQTLVLGQ
jgi:hypothetical protein